MKKIFCFILFSIFSLLGMSSILANVENAYATNGSYSNINYNIMTIGLNNEKVYENVKVDDYYFIPNAYIGGYSSSGNIIVGQTITEQNKTLDENVILKKSVITVRYGDTVIGTVDNGVVTGLEDDQNNYKFVASSLGTYVINYLFKYEKDGQIYTNSFDLEIESSSTIEKNPSEEITDLAPIFQNVSYDYKYSYTIGDEVALPSIVVLDDAVAYMNFDVKVNFVSGEGESETRTPITVYDFSSEREVLGLDGTGKYTVNAGKFIAAFAGRYEVSIAVKDSNNKTVVSFVNYDVSPRTIIIQSPVISTSMENKTVQLDGDTNYDPEIGIEIPTPTISYQIPNSVTYDEYYANKESYTDTDLVVMGVDKNSKATNWSTTYGQEGSFKPEKTGEYLIQYTVKFTVFNHKTFEYQDMAWDDETSSYKGGFFIYQNPTNSSTAEVVLNKDGVYEVNEVGTKYKVIKDEDDSVKVYDYDNDSLVENFYDTIFEDVDLKEWCNDLINYNLASDVYTIIVQDNVGPKVVEYDYVDNITISELESAGDSYKLPIYGIQATDKSGINGAKSRIVVSYRLANGETGSRIYTNQMTDTVYELKTNSGSCPDGTYTITYTVYDNNNNYTTKAYTIAVGDTISPTILINEGFGIVEGITFEKDTQLIIDISKIEIQDNKSMPINYTPTLILNNTSTDEVIVGIENSSIYTYTLNSIGTYALSIEAVDIVGNKTTKMFNFNVVLHYAISVNNDDYGSITETEYLITNPSIEVIAEQNSLRFYPYLDNIIATPKAETDKYVYKFVEWEINEKSAVAHFERLLKKLSTSSDNSIIDISLQEAVDEKYELKTENVDNIKNYPFIKNSKIVAGYKISLMNESESYELTKDAILRFYLPSQDLNLKNIRVYSIIDGELKEAEFDKTETCLKLSVSDLGEFYIIGDVEDNNNIWMIISIVSISVILAGIVLLLILILIKKKKLNKV